MSIARTWDAIKSPIGLHFQFAKSSDWELASGVACLRAWAHINKRPRAQMEQCVCVCWGGSYPAASRHCWSFGSGLIGRHTRAAADKWLSSEWVTCEGIRGVIRDIKDPNWPSWSIPVLINMWGEKWTEKWRIRGMFVWPRCHTPDEVCNEKVWPIYLLVSLLFKDLT